MRQLLIILLFGLLTNLASIHSFAQPDTSKELISRHWMSVKNVHKKFLKTAINFCSINQIKSNYPKATKELSEKSISFLHVLNNARTLDSSIASQIDSLNISLITSLITFFDKLQKDKLILNQSKIRREGKKVEQEIQNIGREIHYFNYWINEKNRINIKFNDINL